MKIENIRKQFPMLNQDITYLDSGALTQKPICVINAINDFYTKYSISNRTSDSVLGILTNQKIQKTREKVAKLLNANPNEIIFNSGTTEGLNYSSQLLEDFIFESDEILISKYNHSSHIIPWVEVAKKKKAKIVFSENIINDINAKTKIICFTQVNNTFNIKTDLLKLHNKAKKHNAIIVNDAAQAISHEKVDSNLFDIIAFSSNKLFGPTGLGILYISKDILNKVKVKKYGGGSIDYIRDDGNWKEKDSIAKHEPGTLNLAGIFGFYEALKFFEQFEIDEIQKYLKELSSYAHDQLKENKNINILSRRGDNIILIDILNSTSQDVSSYLGHKNIYVRNGTFCAKYLENIIEKPMIRISLHIYNNREDIDKLCQALKEGGDFLDFI